MASEPYRKLFALGLGCGILGVSLWPIFLSGQIGNPLMAHSHLMVSGMFLAFVSGFLMTALPKMSGTALASDKESWVAIGLIGSSAIMVILGQSAWALGLAAAQFAFLIQFALRRYIRRISNPPQGLLFVPIGLMWGLIGFLFQSIQVLGFELSPKLSLLAKIGVQQAFLLNLIVGLGSRLIPYITRVADSDPSQRVAESMGRSLAVLVSLNMSFLLEPFLPDWIVYFSRALVLSVSAIAMFSILKKPSQQTAIGTSVRISVLLMILGYLCLALLPQYKLASLHVVFIGGFTLLTLMIATRVVLAHGGQSLSREVKSPALLATMVLLIVATLLRAFYLLQWAAVLWLIAVTVWACSIGRFLYPSSEVDTKRC